MTEANMIEYAASYKQVKSPYDNGDKDANVESRQVTDKLLQPCEDAISRQAIIDMLNDIDAEVNDGCGYMYEHWMDYIKQLPGVTPERPTGHWIVDVDKWGDIVTTVNGYRCDKCNTFNTDKDNYCPNCGYRMVGDDK